VDFLHFLPIKIRASLTGVVSSLFPLQCCFFSDRCHHATAPCYTFSPLSQDEIAASVSSSTNILSGRLPSKAETKSLSPQHRRRLHFSDQPTSTLYCYKKIISTLVTLPTTQPRRHFASSLARAPRHRSSTRRHRSLSPLSHTYRPSAQQHPRWRNSRSSFSSWITYRYVNLNKKYILNSRNIVRGYKLVFYYAFYIYYNLFITGT
jgi:hypothetical protein